MMVKKDDIFAIIIAILNDMKRKLASALLLSTALLSACCSRNKGAREADAALALDTVPTLETPFDGIWQMTCGDVKVAWMPDLTPEKNPLGLFGEIPSEIVESLGIADGIPASMSAVLAQVGDTVILFDAGLGKVSHAEGDPSSNLLGSLDSLGFVPDDIHLIYLTHLHPDHIGGLMKDGKKVFPNAQVWLSRIEYEAWMSMPTEKAAMQQECMNEYSDSLHLFEFGDTLPGGVKAIDAVGHTPGHTAFEISNGVPSARGFLIAGDIMHGVALQMAHPEFSPFYDMDPEASVRTRRRIVEYAGENNLIMTGMHFPEPGFLW